MSIYIEKQNFGLHYLLIIYVPVKDVSIYKIEDSHRDWKMFTTLDG